MYHRIDSSFKSFVCLSPVSLLGPCYALKKACPKENFMKRDLIPSPPSRLKKVLKIFKLSFIVLTINYRKRNLRARLMEEYILR